MRERPPFQFSPFLGARHTSSIFKSRSVTPSVCPSIPNPVVSDKQYSSQKLTVRMKKITKHLQWLINVGKKTAEPYILVTWLIVLNCTLSKLFRKIQ